ncbi:hypothetical protein Tco_0760183 [Tanacetum coccineum]
MIQNPASVTAANGHGDTIQAGKETTVEQKAKEMIFLRHHLHENLKIEYLTVKDPLVIWNHLKDIYEHKKQKITDEEMLEKTFSIFHASNLLLQQQYHERGFRKYCDLISCLLVAEKNNELLMKNHESRPTGSAPLSEANVVTYNQNGGRGHGSDRGRGHGRGRGRGRGQGREFGQGNYHGFQSRNTNGHKKWQDKGKMIKNDVGEKAKCAIENECYRCDKKIDNFDIDSFGIDSLDVDPKEQNDTTYLDVSDFLTNK